MNIECNNIIYTITIIANGFTITVSGFLELNFLDVNGFISEITNFIPSLQNTSGLNLENITVKDLKIIKPSCINNTIDIYSGYDIILNKGKAYFIYYNPFSNFYMHHPYIMPFIVKIVFFLLYKLSFYTHYYKGYDSFKSGLNLIKNKCNTKNILNLENHNSDYTVFMNASASSNNNNNNRDKDNDKNGKNPEKSVKSLDEVILNHRLLHGSAFNNIRQLEILINRFVAYIQERDVRFIYVQDGSRDMDFPSHLSNAEVEEIRSTLADFDLRVTELHDEIYRLLSELYRLEDDYNDIYNLGYRSEGSVRLRNRVFELYQRYSQHFR
jgi:hypothetical protein